MYFSCFSEHFVDATLQFDASYIYEDVNRAIQHVHQSGLVHRGILSDPQRYLVKNMLKEKGKKLLLMTISPYYFVDGVMCFMLESMLKLNTVFDTVTSLVCTLHFFIVSIDSFVIYITIILDVPRVKSRRFSQSGLANFPGVQGLQNYESWEKSRGFSPLSLASLFA
ncbi:hypothetical protein MKX03_007040 [Papaver bracteatum]|nr:hypothetical protein MKX03_007040 [Papaver bracteatum]